MRWEQLFDDLERQLAVEQQRDRLAEVPELIRADWARSELVSRVRVLRGRPVRMTCVDTDVEGTLGRVSREWLSVDTGPATGTVVVRFDAVELFHELPPRHEDPDDGVLDHLGFGHALRGVAAQRGSVAVTTTRGTRVAGRIVAVGADYVDVREASGRRLVVPFGQIGLVRSTTR